MAVSTRIDEVRQLLDLMKERGVTSLKLGDLELHLAPAPPPVDEEAPAAYGPTEAQKRQRHRATLLGAGGRIIERAGE